MWTPQMKSFVTRLVHRYHAELKEKGYDILPIEEVKFSSAINTFGICIRHTLTNTCTIKISERCFYSGEGKLKNTILHELCHCIRDSKGHGAKWQSYAYRIGKEYNTHITQYASKEECANSAEYVKERYNWEVVCECCGNTNRYVRQTKQIKDIMAGNGHRWCCGNCHTTGKFKVKSLKKNVKIYGVR